MLNLIIKCKFMKFLNILTIISVVFLTSCSIPQWAKPEKVKSNAPINAKERARQNVTEGRGISIAGALKRGSTNYEFSTSNPLWRASLEIIDFMPLTTVDYSGGIIITDWYSDGQNFDESIKITLRFLSNEIRSDSIKIIVHNKKCKTTQNCSVNEIDSNIKMQLRQSILRRASLLKKESKEKKKK